MTGAVRPDLDDLKRDGFGQWSDLRWNFITEARWIGIVEQGEQAAASQGD